MQTRGNRSSARRQNLQRELGHAHLRLRSQYDFRRRKLGLERRTRRALIGIDQRGSGSRRPHNGVLLTTRNLDDVEALVAGRNHATIAVGLLVGLAVTVVVHAVTRVRCIRLDVAFRVVAVAFLALCSGKVRHAAVAETIHVVVTTFIDVTVAIVVRAIAEFRRVRERGLVGVIAVLVVLGVAAWQRTHHDRLGSVTVGIAVHVLVEGGLDLLVHEPVTIIVFFVTGFRIGKSTRAANRGRAVVQAFDLAVCTDARSTGFTQLLGAAVVVLRCESFVDLRVAVVIHTVALFRCARVDRIIAVVAVAVDLNDVAIERTTLDGARATTEGVLVAILVEGRLRLQTIVDDAVAIVVLAVTRFTGGIATRRANGRLLVDRTLHLAARTHTSAAGIAQSLGAAVVVLEGESFVGLRVAVVVDTVTNFHSIRIDSTLRVIAVVSRGRSERRVGVLGILASAAKALGRRTLGTEGVLVVVRVEIHAALRVHFVGQTITVIVDAIARFRQRIRHIVRRDRARTGTVRTRALALLCTHTVAGRARRKGIEANTRHTIRSKRHLRVQTGRIHEPGTLVVRIRKVRRVINLCLADAVLILQTTVVLAHLLGANAAEHCIRTTRIRFVVRALFRIGSTLGPLTGPFCIAGGIVRGGAVLRLPDGRGWIIGIRNRRHGERRCGDTELRAAVRAGRGIGVLLRNKTVVRARRHGERDDERCEQCETAHVVLLLEGTHTGSRPCRGEVGINLDMNLQNAL